MEDKTKDDTMVCIPVNEPDNRFVIRAGGNQLYLRDFVKTTAERYIAYYIMEHRMDPTDIIIDMHARWGSLAPSKGPALNSMLNYLREQRGANALIDPLEHFKKTVFTEQNIMKAVLSASEFAIWKMFQLH